jgi:catechol 2,3-dioxygenase-like lactoylglutathione lyase family enzyme
VRITKLDFVSVPARDAERLAEFYADALGLRRDEHSRREVWAGDTCISIWQPDEHGIEFEPQRNGHLALHVEDVEAARKELEAKASSSSARRSTPASATWRSSATPTATT